MVAEERNNREIFPDGEMEDVRKEESAESASEIPADDVEDELDQNERLAFEERIDHAQAKILKLEILLKDRDLSVLDQADIDEAHKLEDARDDCMERFKGGEMSQRDYAQELAEILETLVDALTAWEKQTRSEKSES